MCFFPKVQCFLWSQDAYIYIQLVAQMHVVPSVVWKCGNKNSVVPVTESQYCPVARKTLLKPKSTFLPPVQNPSVETFCWLVEQETFSCLESGDYPIKPNLLVSEKKVLSEIMSDDYIVIKPTALLSFKKSQPISEK